MVYEQLLTKHSWSWAVSRYFSEYGVVGVVLKGPQLKAESLLHQVSQAYYCCEIRDLDHFGPKALVDWSRWPRSSYSSSCLDDFNAVGREVERGTREGQARCHD